MPCDFDPSGRTPVDVVAAIFDLEPAPAATVSPQEIAELRPTAAEVAFGRQFAIGAETLARLLDAIEALTADLREAKTIISDQAGEIDRLTSENARLHERLEDDRAWQMIDGKRVMIRLEPGSIPDGIACRDETIHQQDRVIDDLRAENARLTSEANINSQRAAYWRQKYARLGSEVAAEKGLAESDRYAAYRSHVEAAHAAAVQAQRQAECRNCRDGFPAYGTWPDLHICPMCKRDCRSDAARDHEAEGPRPLADPEYPALVRMARESSKDGD